MKNLKTFTKAFVLLLVLSGGFWALHEAALAQGSLGSDWARFLNDVPTFAADPNTAGEDLAINFVENGIRIIRNIMGGVALVFGIIYAANLVIARGQEEAITKQKKNFLWAFVGFIVLMVSQEFANILNPETATTDQIIDFAATSDQLREISNYLKWLVGSVLVLIMTISGIRLITASGEEEVITSQKRNITWTGIGMLVILLADNIVDAIYVVNEETGLFEGSAGVEAPATEIGGIIRLLLAFLGPMALVFTIYAGFLYLTAYGNEEKETKARRLIIAGVTGIVMIYAAYALVNTFIQTPAV